LTAIPATRNQYTRPLVEPEAPGDPKANVGIGIRRRIVQIQRECPGIRAIVPIAAADEAAP
jgi:hypothetical protein